MPDWRIIRLELGRTRQFPKGSPSRSYLMRLPLDAEGWINALARAADPLGATVRRFWPQQPDRSGYLVPRGDGWGCVHRPGGAQDCFSHLPHQRFCLGESIRVIEADELALPFLVVMLERDAPRSGRRA